MNEKPENLAPEQSGPESLKNHDRRVSTREELNIITEEYVNKGWVIKEQEDNHVKLEKDIDTVQTPTPTMRSTTETLEVNLTLEN